MKNHCLIFWFEWFEYLFAHTPRIAEALKVIPVTVNCHEIYPSLMFKFFDKMYKVFVALIGTCIVNMLLVKFPNIMQVRTFSVMQEIGDFENWMKTMEYDCKSINAAVRNIHQGWMTLGCLGMYLFQCIYAVAGSFLLEDAMLVWIKANPIVVIVGHFFLKGKSWSSVLLKES